MSRTSVNQRLSPLPPPRKGHYTLSVTTTPAATPMCLLGLSVDTSGDIRVYLAPDFTDADVDGMVAAVGALHDVVNG